MKGRMGLVGRLALLAVLIFSGFAGQVRADTNLPPAVGSVAPPAVPATYPIHVLEPSPAGRVGRMALDAADSLQVIERPTLGMKVLVIVDSMIWVEDPDNVGVLIEVPDGGTQMIIGYLDILGIPYEVINVQGRLEGSAPVITEPMLWDGVRHGHYYAIFVSSSTVWWPADPDPANPGSLIEGLTEEERVLIRTYERNFGVRRVTWYAFPEPTQYGLQTVDVGTTDVVTVGLTAAGTEVFGYLRGDLSLPLTQGYTYQSKPVAGVGFTPLLVDGDGNAIVGIFDPTDAGEHLVMTTSSYYPATPPVSLHARLLPYGIINWATKGIFLGERRLYFVPQPDDILSFGDRWDVTINDVVFDTGFRLDADDMDSLVAWMNAFATTPNAADLKIEMPFNGEGVLNDLDANGNLVAGSLTHRVKALENKFVWLNHTYSHADLTDADVALAAREILSNTEVAVELGFTDFVTTTLLTGAYSGLNNYSVISTAYDLGIRYILANASLGQYNNPTPNTGLAPFASQPDLLLVPRLANNIFYFASTPEQEADYYNAVYCPGYAGATAEAPVAPCYTYEELLDLITDQALGFLLDFNINATMFHMNNLDAYDAPTSTKTLLGDYVESLYGKYNSYYNANVPILSLRTQEIGEKMWERMDYNASGVSGIIACTNDITLTMPITAPMTVRVPITGINYNGDDAEAEAYAGQHTTTVTMTRGTTRLIPASGSPAPAAITAPTTPDAVTGFEATVNVDGTRTLTWNPVDGAFGYRIYRGYTVETLVEIDVVAGTTYLDSEITDQATYAVTAIADDCFKQESEPAIVRPAPTSVSLSSLSASPSFAIGLAPLIILPFVGLVLAMIARRRRESRS